jgi:hypothetical protein
MGSATRIPQKRIFLEAIQAGDSTSCDGSFVPHLPITDSPGFGVTLSQSCQRDMPTFREFKGGDSAFGGRAIANHVVLVRGFLNFRR